MRIFVASLVSLGTTMAIATQDPLADQGVGNGGDVIVCDESSKEPSIQLLDYFEARKFHGVTANLGDPEEAVDTKIRRIIDRVTVFVGFRQELLKIYDEYWDKVHFFEGNLSDIPDSHHVGIPNGCQIEQAALFYLEPPLPDWPKYILSADIWSQLDNNLRAGLVLHELIYIFATRFTEQRNSIPSRFVNAWLASDRFENGHAGTKWQVYKTSGFATRTWEEDLFIEVSGRRYRSHPETRFYSNGQLEVGILKEEASFLIQSKEVGIRRGPVYFHSNGMLRTGNISNPIELAAVSGETFKVTYGLVLSREGWLLEGFIADTPMTYAQDCLILSDFVKFYETGEMHTMTGRVQELCLPRAGLDHLRIPSFGDPEQVSLSFFLSGAIWIAKSPEGFRDYHLPVYGQEVYFDGNLHHASFHENGYPHSNEVYSRTCVHADDGTGRIVDGRVVFNDSGKLKDGEDLEICDPPST